ncbi:hypothetical protein ACJ4V0_15635 [Phreatobacter sp. HK31-P]
MDLFIVAGSVGAFLIRSAEAVWSMTVRLGIQHLERGFPFNSPLRRETSASRAARRA